LTTADLVSHCIMYTDDMFYIQRAVALSWIKWMQINYNYNYNYTLGPINFIASFTVFDIKVIQCRFFWTLSTKQSSIVFWTDLHIITCEKCLYCL